MIQQMITKSALAFIWLALVLPCPAYAVDIQEITAPKSGIKIWLVEDHTLPIIALRMAFAGGSEQDPVDKQGLATLSMDMLTEGAGTYTAQSFQNELADHSITLGFEAGRDDLSGGFKCLSEDRAKAFDLLHLALTKPRLDAKDVERLRARQMAALKQQISDPGWQARYALFSQIYAGHPYSERHLGSMKTLSSLTREDVRGFIAHHMAKDNMIVAVAGDITASDLAASIDRMAAGLPAHASLNDISDAPDAHDVPTTLVRREGTQTEILFSMPGPKRNDPDFYAAEIANYIIGGGGFSSLLMQDVRDKKGLTYGIETNLSPSEHSGLIVGQAAVDNPKVGEALAAIHDTMQSFHDDGVKAKEVAAAKDFLTGSQPLALTTTDKIADMMIVMQRDKLGRDYLDRYADLIRSVSDDDLARVIDKWFNPANMTLVMVGKPEGVTVAQTKEMMRQ